MLHHALMRGGALLAFLATPINIAAAQEAARSEPVAGGLRVEALLGADTDGYEHGAVYGGRIGYDLHIGHNVLLGAEAELNDVTTDQEFFGSPIVLDDGPDLYVGGRLTVRVARRINLYGALGYTRARQSFFFLIDPNQPLGPVGGEQSYHDGLRTTLGGQFSIGRRAFLGAEYRFSDYGERFLTRGQLVGSIGFRF